jgi:hypothetical protein
MDDSSDRPLFDVGGILRRWGDSYVASRPVPTVHRRVIRDLSACRTAVLGGHLEQCDSCGYEHPVYNSCGNRHCPQCQSRLARRWLRDRMAEVLPIPYFHCVFTIPDTFNVLVPRNERVVYGLLFRAAWQTLEHFFKRRLGGTPGVTAVFHSWGQTLWLHPHVHCIVTGGALSSDRQAWISTGSEFLFDVFALAAEFKRRFCRLLRRADLVYADSASQYSERAVFDSFLEEQEARNWVVYCKKPFAGPESVLEYVSRYTHRVAISNRRIEDVSDDGTVTFAYQNYRQCDGEGRASRKTMQLDAHEFIRRFLLHVLPPRFRKIRMYGILAGHEKFAKLTICCELLGANADPPESDQTTVEVDHERVCPQCGNGQMRPAGTLAPQLTPELTVVQVRAPPRAGYRHAA